MSVEQLLNCCGFKIKQALLQRLILMCLKVKVPDFVSAFLMMWPSGIVAFYKVDSLIVTQPIR